MYDGSDQRVVKTAVDTQGQEVHTVYAFGSLELRRAAWAHDASQGSLFDYQDNEQTEVVFLSAHGARLARLHLEDGLPALGGSTVHVLLELADHPGSGSIVIDRATSELAERMTYTAYGAAESDYRPGRWKAFREDYRFTGKEEDVEVGLQYFGKRYYAPQLGRWGSADPLTVHGADADPNAYAYVHGTVLRAVDPVGLDRETMTSELNNQEDQEHAEASLKTEGGRRQRRRRRVKRPLRPQALNRMRPHFSGRR